MAQSVKIAGALFSNVPSIQVPDENDVFHPFVDPSPTTATAADVASGKIFIAADGTQTTGTASGGSATIVSKTITSNGTYNASADSADGYDPVVVNVAGGGFLPLIHTETLGTFSSVPTSETNTGKSISLTTAEIDDYDILLVEIVRDTLEAGYLWASYSFVALMASDGYDQGKNNAYRLAPIINIRKTSTNEVQNTTHTTAYGFFVSSSGLSISGGILTVPILMRRSNSYTASMNGTFTMNVYGLDLLGHLTQ